MADSKIIILTPGDPADLQDVLAGLGEAGQGFQVLSAAETTLADLAGALGLGAAPKKDKDPEPKPDEKKDGEGEPKPKKDGDAKPPKDDKPPADGGDAKPKGDGDGGWPDGEDVAEGQFDGVPVRVVTGSQVRLHPDAVEQRGDTTRFTLGEAIFTTHNGALFSVHVGGKPRGFMRVAIGEARGAGRGFLELPNIPR